MPSKQRKNITCACAGCRVAKVRCDGGNPCDRCCSKGLQCFYPSQKKRGFPKKSAMHDKETLHEPTINNNQQENHNTELTTYNYNQIYSPPPERIVSFEDSAHRQALLSIYLGNFHVEKYSLVPTASLIQPITDSDKVMQLISLATSARSSGKLDVSNQSSFVITFKKTHPDHSTICFFYFYFASFHFHSGL
jgi:hypothetical protein